MGPYMMSVNKRGYKCTLIVGSVLMLLVYSLSQSHFNHPRTKGLGDPSAIMTSVTLSTNCSFLKHPAIFVQCVSNVIFIPPFSAIK